MIANNLITNPLFAEPEKKILNMQYTYVHEFQLYISTAVKIGSLGIVLLGWKTYFAQHLGNDFNCQFGHLQLEKNPTSREITLFM